MVRVFFGLLILITIGWSGYWYVGSSAQQRGMQTWLDDRTKAGWVSDYDDLTVQGFPSRFDTKITNLNLADPHSGWAWQSPELQILMLSYKPNHIIASLPPEQTISTPQERITVRSDDMRASIKFDANTDLALNAVSGEMTNVVLKSNAGWTSQMRAAQLATRQTPGIENAHDIFFQADDLKPARIFTNIIDPDSQMPDVFETMRMDITAGFTAPWDRHAIEGQKPEFTRLAIKDFSAKWGELNFQAKGDLTFDADGYPSGKVSVRAQNWKDMIALAVSAGAIPEDLQSTLESGLGLLARLSGNPNTIDAPLSFSNRVISLGPIPIGRAPQITMNP